ncbi:helix-turn-helix transcriptional regulator [Demequina litorisediminis]|uniref:WYL domain-containing protein n=1 Tax=Demequina litorisediminis TaxID=1849022 RepID=A0ABQ6I9D9_9MICO|nr:WYL domain-containing protein [Demequina litorisediminis]GMA34331.1 hypothetical protein GCM10025876_05350 [Demequina litorisediminis]
MDGTSTALSAIARLEQVLSPTSRRQVTALATAMTSPDQGRVPHVPPALLGQVALACRDHERVRFAYEDAQGAKTRRRVEPHALAPARGRWYLVGWDLEREDWRTFRLDRMGELTATGAHFSPRPLTRADIDERILVASSAQRQPLEAVAVLPMPLTEFEEHMGVWAEGSDEPTPGVTHWGLGGADVRDLFYGLSWLPTDVEWRVDMPDEARADLTGMLRRVLRAVEAD